MPFFSAGVIWYKIIHDGLWCTVLRNKLHNTLSQRLFERLFLMPEQYSVDNNLYSIRTDSLKILCILVNCLQKSNLNTRNIPCTWNETERFLWSVIFFFYVVLLIFIWTKCGGCASQCLCRFTLAF